MEYIVGESREQILLFPETLDDLISEENPVRFIDLYIDKLDLKLLNFKLRKSNIGRPAYSEKVLLKIYIYGYMNRIRSSRRLENECKRNIELMWLTKRLAPDFKTIADFRKDNKEGIKRVHKEFLKLCHKLGLLSFEIVGIDGTKMRAQNSNDNIYKREEIEKVSKQIDEKIEEYLKELDKNDQSEMGEYESLKTNIKKRLKRLISRKEKIEKIREMFEENAEIKRYFGNDPECEFMKDKGCIRPGYNVQSAVDDKNKLIVAIDVVNESYDSHQLTNMSEKVEEIKAEIGFEEERKTKKVADAGYFGAEEIMKAKDKGHDVYVANSKDKNKGLGNRYSLGDFSYNKEKDVYICPCGKELVRKSRNPINRDGKLTLEYICKSCNTCKDKELCTKSKEGKKIEIYIRKEEMDKYNNKIMSEEGKRLIGKRKELCEHPFGTIKRNLGYDYFLLKGRDGALTEFSIISMVYNMKRVLNIFGVKELLEVI